jgi:hypothetical protein
MVYSDAAMMIVYDSKPTGVLPAVTDILESASSNAMNKADNAGRFRILRRHDSLLVADSTAARGANAYKDLGDFLLLHDLKTVYKSAGTGAIGDIESGALYLVTIGNQTEGTLASNMNLAFRLRYYDIN